MTQKDRLHPFWNGQKKCLDKSLCIKTDIDDAAFDKTWKTRYLEHILGNYLGLEDTAAVHPFDWSETDTLRIGNPLSCEEQKRSLPSNSCVEDDTETPPRKMEETLEEVSDHDMSGMTKIYPCRIHASCEGRSSPCGS
jgi:hypothetical protein